MPDNFSTRNRVSACKPISSWALACLLVALSCTEPSAWLHSSKKILALKAEANGLYRQKKYAEACPIYREITERDTLDAGALTDLGICLQNLGKKDSVLHVSREALRLAGKSLASPSVSDWSNLDLRARKSAYFNLDKLGDPMREPDSGSCETWAAFAVCGKAFYVCSDVGRVRTARGYDHWAILRVGLTREQAIFSAVEAETQADLPRPEVRDMEEVDVDGEFESKLKWLNRDSVVTLPLGEIFETRVEGCSSCQATEKVMTECRVLHFNPCTGVVGVACAVDQGGGDDRIVIGEYYLIPAR